MKRVNIVIMSLLGSIVLSCSQNDVPDTEAPTPVKQGGTVSTFAGDGTFGNNDGTLTTARFASPSAIAVDVANTIFIADKAGNVIRKISISGEVSTYAGTGEEGFEDGPLSSAKFNRPSGLAFDSHGDLYVADRFNNVIRKITSTGTVTTYAGKPLSIAGEEDGAADEARFNKPTQIVFDSDDNLYVTDQWNGKIRKITPAGMVSTFAVDPEILSPFGITMDSHDNLYVSDQSTHKISKITPTGEVSHFAGSSKGESDGAANVAQFNGPGGLRFDTGGTMYIADIGNSKIRKINSNGQVSTLAGNALGGYVDGSLDEARFENPNDLYIDMQGDLLILDTENFVLRKITFN